MPQISSASVSAMLDARTIAVVGASSRAGSFGERMVTEVGRSSGNREIYYVNPRTERSAIVRACPASPTSTPRSIW